VVQPVPALLIEAREALEPLFRAAGYRFVGQEPIGEGGRSGVAEYRTSARRLRIVVEVDENVIWVDTAVERDAQIISQWTDIEWALAGKRLPPIPGTSPDRIVELTESAARYLSERAS